MPVDPELELLLAAVNAAPPLELGPDAAPDVRVVFAATSQLFGTGPEDVEVEDRTIPGPGGDLPIRVYRPPGASSANGAAPVVVWFHGGGFVIGDLDTADAE